MKRRRDWVKENVMEYLHQQNISGKQIKKDTGLDIETREILQPEEFFLLCSYLRREPEYFMDPFFGEKHEAERIRQVFQNHKETFHKLNAKVAFTEDNEAYFFRYIENTNDCEMFTKIEKAEELEQILQQIKEKY